MRVLAFLALMAMAGLVSPVSAQAVDDKAAEKLLKDNDCSKCHTVSREKEGPPYKKTAAKYKGNAEAEQKLFVHLTTEPIVKVEGKEEKHKKIVAESDDDVKNLVQWILSR